MNLDIPEARALRSTMMVDKDVTQLPLIGDFNGDDRTDLFWYTPGDPEDQLWLSTSNQEGVLFDATPEQVIGEHRPYVGDFDGNGVHDILWYSVLDEVEGGLSAIWYFDDSGSHETQTFSVHGDYTPVVDDFDRDGCTDVMWYEDASDDPQTVVWRCVIGESDIACDAPSATPPRESGFHRRLLVRTALLTGLLGFGAGCSPPGISSSEEGCELGPYIDGCFDHIDAPVVTVTIPVTHSTLGFSYPSTCAPAPLLEADGLCQDLIAKMPSCDSSPYIEDCEVIE